MIRWLMLHIVMPLQDYFFYRSLVKMLEEHR